MKAIILDEFNEPWGILNLHENDSYKGGDFINIALGGIIKKSTYNVKKFKISFSNKNFKKFYSYLNDYGIYAPFFKKHILNDNYVVYEPLY